LEFQGEWIPVRNLSLSVTYAFNESEIKSGCALASGAPAGACFVDPLDPLATGPQANPVGLVGGNVVQSVKGAALPQASRHRVALNATYSWDLPVGAVTLSGSYVWRDATHSAIFQRDYNRAPAWDQVDVRATWRSPGERYALVGYVRNVFDTLGYTVALDGTGAFNGSALPSARHNIYELTPPRTYGLELRYRF
jgi:iron complex outermembrane receptor protein